MASALIDQCCGIFYLPIWNQWRSKDCSRQRKQTEKSKEPTHPFFHLIKLPFLAGTHIKYIRSSKGGIAEFLIWKQHCPEKASVVSNTELLGRKLIIMIWWSERFLQWTEKGIFALYSRLQLQFGSIDSWVFIYFWPYITNPIPSKMPIIPVQCSTSAMWDCQLKKTIFSWDCIFFLPVPSQTHHSHPYVRTWALSARISVLTWSGTFRRKAAWCHSWWTFWPGQRLAAV